MYIDEFMNEIRKLDISVITGIPDSALKPFCDYCNSPDLAGFHHCVPANEGAAVGIAIGVYLASKRPACVYMQNSGLGNGINPITSLANFEVYGIPMLLVIGWRGEPGQKDEPQHRFMGAVTEQLLHTLSIEYTVLSDETGPEELKRAFEEAKRAMKDQRQYAFLVKKGAFEKQMVIPYQNPFLLKREQVIASILASMDKSDLVVSTTGKISREVYECANQIWGNHDPCFLTVGGMGHAAMIAYGIAISCPDRNVYCIEGDGAILMHLGNTAYIGSQRPKNLIHICLNNQAHESVGGMPTHVKTLDYWRIARDAGYETVHIIETEEDLGRELHLLHQVKKPAFLEIRVSMEVRSDLGRPRECAVDNKNSFMKAISNGYLPGV